MALITGFGSKLSRLYQRWAHLQTCTLITAQRSKGEILADKKVAQMSHSIISQKKTVLVM